MPAAIPVAWKVRATLAIIVIPPLLELLSLDRLQHHLARVARLGIVGGTAPQDRVAAQWVDRQLDRLPPPWKRTCLRRAAVLYFLIRGQRRPVELCIGVKRIIETGELLAHAWLLLDDALYLEPPFTTDVVSEYTLLARFPSIQTGERVN